MKHRLNALVLSQTDYGDLVYKFCQASTKNKPSSPLLTLSSVVLTDLPPNCTQRVPFETHQELLTKMEHLQRGLIQAEKAFMEISQLKDENIEFLKTEIKNLPAVIRSQVIEHLSLNIVPML